MADGFAYPIFVDLVQRPVLIVGGGKVGVRKARGLVECGAKVTVVSLEFAEEFGGMAGVEKIVRGYTLADIYSKKWRLVFAATAVGAVNAAVAADAAAAGILCCRVDEPEGADFSGAAVERLGLGGAVTVAVGTSGGSPLLAARVARQAAAGIDPVLVRQAALAVGWRARVKAAIHDVEARRPLLQRMAGEEMEKILRSEGETVAQQRFDQWLATECGQAVGMGARRAH